jgi:hypothetical protein
VPEASYSPRLRTGVVLCGAGTAGSYQAGVLRALVEAGIKIDVFAAHGIGILTALCAAIDGTARLWDAAGPWTDVRLRRAYRWRAALRTAALALLAGIGVLLLPLVVMIAAALLYALSTVASAASLPDLAADLVARYRGLVEWLFAPPILPTVVPRLALLAMLVVAGVLVAAAARSMRGESRRRRRGAFWWRLIGSPLESHAAESALLETLWRLVRGASNEPRPAAAEIGRRYVDLLLDNAGQPGFRDVIVAVHDLDARRDLVGAVLPDQAREVFETRRYEGSIREAESILFRTPTASLVSDFLHAGMRLPIATEPHLTEFPADSYWRGEAHRLCDRPELAVRLVEELAALGVEQIVLVSPAGPPALPHGMRGRPLDLRGRMGEVVRSIETAVIEDAARGAAARFSGVFVIRPEHNPIGPFDLGGVYDEASDRRRTTRELMQQGYADAYRLFIEPVVAAGERVEML